MFVPSFLALWWPKIDQKSGFPKLFAKTVGSIHFIPGIYTYGVSLWTPIDFRVRALIFGPLVAKNWPKIGVSATFLRKLFLRFPNFLYQLQPQYLPYHDTLVGRVMPKFFSNKFFLNDSHQCSYHNDLKIGLFVGYFLMGWVLIRAGVYCPHLWAQLVWSEEVLSLTHWGRVMHICVSKQTIVGSDNGLLPGRRQAIIWTNAGILLTGTLETNFNEISIKIRIFSFKKMGLNMSSVKWQPFCLGLNVLN